MFGRPDEEVGAMGGKQLSFADALSDPRLGANRRLEGDRAGDRLGAAGGARGALRPGRPGRAPYEPLAMLKALLLQRPLQRSPEGEVVLAQGPAGAGTRTGAVRGTRRAWRT